MPTKLQTTNSQPMEIKTDVLIAGGGPCGLMLAIELGRRGIACLLVDAKPSTAFNPQANATQARTWSTSVDWALHTRSEPWVCLQIIRLTSLISHGMPITNWLVSVYLPPRKQ